MKKLLLFLFLAGVLCAEEDITLAQNAVMKGDHTMMSIKAGTIVTLIERGPKFATIRYKEVVGTIPVGKLEAPAAGSGAPASSPAPSKDQPPAQQNPPQTGYGKAVQKAKENAGKHEKNLVKPTDEVIKDQ